MITAKNSRHTALLALSLFLLINAVITGSVWMYGAGQPDPFAPFEGIMPGQSISGLARYACTEMEQLLPERSRVFSCHADKDPKPVHLVAVFGQDNTIRGVIFHVDGLRFGDLLLRWGQPRDVEKYERHCVARWQTGTQASLNPCTYPGHQVAVVAVIMQSG